MDSKTHISKEDVYRIIDEVMDDMDVQIEDAWRFSPWLDEIVEKVKNHGL